MRAWRKAHPLKGEQRKRDIARSYAHVYLRRGLITRDPCWSCGADAVHMHHPDYDRPKDVVWLCLFCHGDEHGIDMTDASVHSDHRVAKRETD